jgi:hypothetical protein
MRFPVFAASPRALYLTKHSGRNQLILADDDIAGSMPTQTL